LKNARILILQFSEDNVNPKKSPFSGGAIKLKIQAESIKSVIPESAVGGCPESRNNDRLLDTGSRPP
jgi:hypothetical protein